jgi:diguanylate cyclase (GGDEF)-like protein
MALSWLGVPFHPEVLLTAWAVGGYGFLLQCLVVRRVRAHERDAGVGWLLGGSLCVGTGAWAQTFLGLVAWQTPIPVGYGTAVVLAAWLPAVVVSLGAMWQFSHRRLDWRLRILGGLFVSVGLTLLTFIALAAVVTSPGWHVAIAWGLAGFGVYLLACACASWLTRRHLYNPGGMGRLVSISAGISALFLLAEMTMMHVAVIPVGATSPSLTQLSGNALHSFAAAVAMLMLLVVHLGVMYDERVQRLQAALSRRLAQAQTALEEAAQHDPATGLLNRPGFEQALEALLQQDNSANGPQLAVVRLSLDGFKSIVETYGQTLGDHVVRLLSGRLQAQLRQGDVIARTDSDEFMVGAPGLADEHQVAQWALRLAHAVHEPCLIEDLDLCLSSSIGIARQPDSAGVSQLMAHSLDAMLMARKAGGGVHCLYQRGMDRHGHEQVSMQRDLRHAIARGELSLHFQPKLRATDGKLAGVEALLRWKHPERGQVSPVDFIPVAERFGLIGELGLWVLDQACAHVRQWHDAGLDIPVAVNLSAHQLRQPDLELRVRDALKRHRVPARMLIMEITESTAMDDIEASLKVFDMLDAIGVRLSIDDFGTGYSSLSYLRRLPARQLKIDRSFVRDLGSSLDAQAIVEAVVRLAHALGLKVVAEGVETLEQAAILRQLQCDELQGFLFARPMPEQALLAWLVQQDVGVLAASDATPEDYAKAVNPMALAQPDRVVLSAEVPHSHWDDLEAQAT